ncbi:MAG: diphthamide biosynthesis enzyme Dph2 [Candidatus Caldarchaeum sp.]|nr:diphthamide biosynthesis enzyme Dph2 [Candidatus Caldarchaeum sp.]
MLTIMNYKVEVDEAVRALREMKASSVLVQSPLGLRSVALRVGEMLRKEGFAVVLSSSNCWGGCDVAFAEAKSVNVDAIVHLGHSRFLRTDLVPTIYLECRYADRLPLEALYDKVVDQFNGLKTVGVGASVQWLDFLPDLIDCLKSRGFVPLTAEPSMFSVYEAQVLGCDVSSLKRIEKLVDGFLVVGSIFHGLGLAVSTCKPVIAADPHSQKVKNLAENRERLLKQRYAQIDLFKNASKIGVLVSIKPGQKRMAVAGYLNQLLIEKGKQSFIVLADEVTSSTVNENRFDAFVNTACPRLSLEDQATFGKPMLLPVEVLVALGLVDWDEVVEKGFIMYPWGWHEREVGEKFWNLLLRARH